MSGICALLWSNYIAMRRACAPTTRGEGKRLNGRNKARRAVIGSYYTSYPSLCLSPPLLLLSLSLAFYSLFVYLAWPTGATQAVGDTLDLASSHHSHVRDDVARLRYLTQCRTACYLLFLFHRALRSTLFAKPEASHVNGELYASCIVEFLCDN